MHLTSKHIPSQAQPRVLATASLAELTRRIEEASDREALGELVAHRRPFRAPDGKRVTLIEFIDDLCGRSPWRWLAGGSSEAVEEARDLTIDKLTNLPVAKTRKGAGPNAKRYWVAFNGALARAVGRAGNINELERELLTTRCLQDFVIRQFWLSCLECARRSQRLMKRYTWHLPDGCLQLWRPADVSADRLVAWLQVHTGNVSARRSGERERVQALIDARFGWRREFHATPKNLPAAPVERPVEIAEHRARNRDLAATVAREKAATVSLQRRTIRDLGPDRLHNLVLRVFHNLDDGSSGMTDAALAAEFGLSKPAYSRFAGRKWHRTESMVIPDLWRNTATVLAADSDFVVAAKEAGVWPAVERVLAEADGQPA